MSHYEERLARDLERIEVSLEELAGKVERAIDDSGRALLENNHDLAYQAILRDQVINRDVAEIEKYCHYFVARHLPSAGHLRFVSSVLRLIIALERIGDYAVTVCRETVRQAEAIPEDLRADLAAFFEHAEISVRDSMSAFLAGDADRAQSSRARISGESGRYDAAFAELVDTARKDSKPVKDLFSLLVVVNRLSRMCDQAKNICEETVFVVTGRLKPPKHFKIMFVDRRNDCLSQMGEAIGKKAFGEAASFTSAGWEPAANLDPKFLQFMDDHGHQMNDFRPKELEDLDEVAEYIDIIVSLEDGFEAQVEKIPYRIVHLHWEMERCPENSAEEGYREQLQARYKAIAAELRDLFEVLRGDSQS